jgi:hypothetical protein
VETARRGRLPAGRSTQSAPDGDAGSAMRGVLKPSTQLLSRHQHNLPPPPAPQETTKNSGHAKSQTNYRPAKKKHPARLLRSLPRTHTRTHAHQKHRHHPCLHPCLRGNHPAPKHLVFRHRGVQAAVSGTCGWPVHHVLWEGIAVKSRWRGQHTGRSSPISAGTTKSIGRWVGTRGRHRGRSPS